MMLTGLIWCSKQKSGECFWPHDRK